jgi:phage tail-like protein
MPETGKRQEAFGAYYFKVEIEGQVYPFRSCSGLKSESTTVELQEGGFNTTTRKLIGPTKFPNLVLKQGLFQQGTGLWKLRKRALNDQPKPAGEGKGWRTPERFNGTITQLGPNGSFAKWVFVNGWICKWEGPDLDASKNEISVETIEIAHEGLELVETKGIGDQ